MNLKPSVYFDVLENRANSRVLNLLNGIGLLDP
jgi:hypothetical protein